MLSMFIRRVPHKDSKNRKEYCTYKLVESFRTQRGPRQRDVLNLGVHFDLPREQWKDLSNCIEEIITGQKSLIDYPKEIKAFYMRQNDDNKTVAAMDVLVPKVGEIIGGSQREERLDVLEKRMNEMGKKAAKDSAIP